MTGRCRHPRGPGRRPRIPRRPRPGRRRRPTGRARRSRAPARRPRAPCSASTNAATGPLPRPSTVTGTPPSVSSPTSRRRCSPSARSAVPVGRTGPTGRRGRAGTRRRSRPHLLGRDLAALVVGVLLDDPGELDLQPAGQVEAVLGLHDVGDAALAGLAVHPDDRLVGAADVLGVDRQVRDLPRMSSTSAGGLGVGLQRVEALLDRVLVGAGERGVDQVAAVGVALVDAAAGCSTRRCGGSRRCRRSRSAGRRRG